VIDALGPTTEIADIEDLAHVALDVGGDVAGEPFGGVDVGIERAGHGVKAVDALAVLPSAWPTPIRVSSRSA